MTRSCRKREQLPGMDWHLELNDMPFDAIKKGKKNREELIQELYQQIGKLKVERDWIKKRLDSLRKTYSVGVSQIRLHIEKPGQDLPSIHRQATLLNVVRSSVYYQPKPVDVFTLEVTNRIDEIYTKRPFFGVRRITEQLRRDGTLVNHKRVHNIKYPYLLRNVPIVKANQVWGTDITYIRMQYGSVYLTVFLDWYTRYILSWRLSTTLERTFCLEAANRSNGMVRVTGNCESGSGSAVYPSGLLQHMGEKGVQISMDGRGRAMDNIFTERLWRTIKYEEVYLKDYATVLEVKEEIGDYFKFYNYERKHQSHNYKTPAEIYF